MQSKIKLNNINIAFEII